LIIACKSWLAINNTVKVCGSDHCSRLRLQQAARAGQAAGSPASLLLPVWLPPAAAAAPAAELQQRRLGPRLTAEWSPGSNNHSSSSSSSSSNNHTSISGQPNTTFVFTSL
jgi:hypothetical protein